MSDPFQSNSEKEVLELNILRAKVVEVFHCVSLAGGIGLRQADGIDDRKPEDVCQLLREGDEKDDWRRIPRDDLNRYSGSLTFLDPLGMRFYLPAFLIADIDGQVINSVDQFGLLSRFIDLSDHRKYQFSKLSLPQRLVIGEYLRYVQDQPGHWLDVHKIDEAIGDFWNLGAQPHENQEA